MEDFGYIEHKKEKIERLVAKILKGGAPAKIALQELRREVGDNPFVDYARGYELLSERKKKEAEQVLLASLERFPFYLLTRMLLLEIYKERGDKRRFLEHYELALRYASLGDDSEEIEKIAEGMNVDRTKLHLEEPACLNFELDIEGNSMIRKRILEGRTDDKYLLNVYRDAFSKTIVKQNDSLVKAELYRGDYAEKCFEIEKNEGDVLVVSAMSDEPFDLTFHTPEGTVHKKELPFNRFHYYNLPSQGIYRIESDGEVFFSHLKCKKIPDSPKLVLYLFIDGLSCQFLKDHAANGLTPNIDRFFKNAYVNGNCHSNAEWTLPSVMSMTTGKYLTKHRLYHPRWNYDAEKYSKLMPEYFQEAGYLTGRICCNWRTNPFVAYYKGVDRTVYCPMRERMYASEMVTEAIEHIESFKDFHNFLWLTIEDLHSVPEGVDNSLLGSCYQQALSSTLVEEGEKKVSVFQTYSEDKNDHYAAEIKKIDFYLGFLFDYIEKNYNEQEFLLVLNSDHGQGFLTPNEELFNMYRSNVPLMMRGRAVPNMKSRELVSNVDILPTLLSLCGLSEAVNIDGQLMKDFGGEERDYAYAESVAYGQEYRAALIDKDHYFTLVSNEEKNQYVRINGLLNIFYYDVLLLDRESGEDVTEQEKEKIAKYKREVYEHVKSWIEL